MDKVSALSILLMAVTLGISFLFPIGLMIYYRKKEKIDIIAVLIGALIFFVSQLVLRIPMLNIMSSMGWLKGISNNLWLSGIFLGLTAGLFEEIGRFIGFKFLLKKRLEWKNGVAYGIGHGGIESILLVGMTYVNNLIYSFLINGGVFDKIASQLPGDTAQMIFDGLVKSRSTDFLLGGNERFFTIFVHIALSLVVLYAVMNRKYIFLALSVLLHTLLNAPLPLLTKYFGAYTAEGYIVIWGILSIIFVFKSKKIFSSKVYATENTL
jgi:uncharacterized membrane protein YhfC